MNGYVPKRRGVVEHLRDGRMTLQMYAAHDLLVLLADKATGIWIGSAKAFAANCGAGDVSERRARHILESLELGGYIKRFPIRRSHRNYPILISRFQPTSGAYSGMRLNAAATKDWRSPVYDSCQEHGAQPGAEPGAEPGVERAPIREGEGEREGEKHAQATKRPSPSVFAGTNFEVSQRQDQILAAAFPWADRQAQYRKAESWIEANPQRAPKSRKGRFLHHWFSRIPAPSEKVAAPDNRLSPQGAERLKDYGVKGVTV